jgi:hypothetical protein
MSRIKLDYSRGKFAKQDLQLIKLLERQPESPFWDLVDTARVAVRIKDDKYLTGYTDVETYKTTQSYARKIIDLFGLPSSWLHPLSDYLVCMVDPIVNTVNG